MWTGAHLAMWGQEKAISTLKISADRPKKFCFRCDHARGTSTHLATSTHSTVPTHLPGKTVSQPRTAWYRSLQHTPQIPNTDPILSIPSTFHSVCFSPMPSELKGFYKSVLRNTDWLKAKRMIFLNAFALNAHNNAHEGIWTCYTLTARRLLNHQYR